MGRLDDRVIIVTGGAHGIGRAYCLGLANEGAKVVVADLDGPGAESVVRTLGESGNDALAVVADVSAPDDTEETARAAMDRFGRMDG
jgi:3-oxoacyl-[acyl-carrier protein] reductase